MKSFLIPSGLSPKRAVSRLERAFTIEGLGGVVERQRRYFDTFDHRLLRRGLVLVEESGRLVLETDRGSESSPSGTVGRSLKSSDISDTGLRSALAPVLGLRAALDQALVDERQARWAILNADKKTVAWVHYRAGEVSADGERYPLIPTLSVVALRGFTREGKLAASVLAEFLAPAADVGHPLKAALLAMGRSPFGFVTKPDSWHGGSQRADDALVTMVQAQLRICAATVSGTIEDIDTEFLHDLRVSLRKARSLLKDGRGAFPSEPLNEAQAALRVLAHGTNQLRDLDVFLLARDRYTELLPPELSAGVATLYGDLGRRRRRAQGKVSQLLAGPSFEAALRSVDRLGDTKGRRPCGSLEDHARRVVARRFKRVCKAGDAITTASPDEELHELRIHCKRLRYGLELYGRALGDTKPAVRQLKVLQGVLGDFNDLSVQRERLVGCLGRGKTGTDPMVCAAVGGLIAALAREQSRVRETYWSAYQDFSRRRVKRLFTELTTAPRVRRRAA